MTKQELIKEGLKIGDKINLLGGEMGIIVNEKPRNYDRLNQIQYEAEFLNMQLNKIIKQVQSL